MARFKAGRLSLLVATDVAARGLDVPGVDAVINYDFPYVHAHEYVHRVGRTGRATSPPPQFGQTPPSRPPAQLSQKVHSNEQMKAPGASAGRSTSQHSQPGRMSSIRQPPFS